MDRPKCENASLHVNAVVVARPIILGGEQRAGTESNSREVPGLSGTARGQQSGGNERQCTDSQVSSLNRILAAV
jgi:hypothetical protein